MVSLTDSLKEILVDFKNNIEEKINEIQSNVNPEIANKTPDFDSGWIEILSTDIKIKNTIGKEAYFIVIQEYEPGKYIIFTHSNEDNLYMTFDNENINLTVNVNLIKYSSSYKTKIRILGFKI